jgi:hypothetical protein|tara:strand:- start:1614 stop:2345 length:732 start_codon:yes stop_codon:yes gene_type:complete
MTEAKIIERLRNDEDYYGKFGKQYMSNSDIGTLLKDPLSLGVSLTKTVPMLIGGYFHTAVLEPDKLHQFTIIEASTRNTKKYKEISGGEMCLLQHEVDMINVMSEKLLANNVIKDLIQNSNNEYEKPGLTKLNDLTWKGKADILNHDDKLIIDLKTTNDIDAFKYSAKKYNYDSQAYIYSKIFGYEFLFIAIDKNTHKIGLFDCSTEFYQRGEDKVAKACEIYDLFYNNDNFDKNQYFINNTL